MRKIIQYYSFFITLFLFSSVPSYTERESRRSRKELESTKKRNVDKQGTTSSKKGFIVAIGGTVVFVFACNNYSKRSSLSSPISTSIDPDLTKLSIDKLENHQNNRQNQTGKTSFLQAAKGGELAIAKLLKQRGASINAKDKDGCNALHLACLHSGSVPMVTWLLDVCNIDLETKGFKQRTPFLFAAEKGQHAIAKLLRERGANINAEDKEGCNALHAACAFSGNENMVTWLLDICKIDKETKGFKQRTPFLFAAERGQHAIAKLLMQRGTNINAIDESKYNALHLACLRSKNVDMVTWLLDICSIGIETKDFKKRTPFLLAAEEGQLAIAELLRERGTNINAIDKSKYNALHLACLHSGSVPMVTWLLNVCKIGIETKGPYQMTPFLFAAAGGHLAIAKLLKQRGANINAKSKKGNNALHWARLRSNNIDMINYLKNLGLRDNR